jgi:cytochrome c oxidase assembly factor CtaG
MSGDQPENLREESKRIVPLGLTVKEAEGWYLHEVTRPLLSKAMATFSFGIAVMLPTLTPLNSDLESTLTLHIILQHLLFIAGGFLFAYGSACSVSAGSGLSRTIWKARSIGRRMNSAFNRQGITTFLIAGSIIVYWQIPKIFDAATLNESAHVTMHFTLLIVGGLIYVGSTSLIKEIRGIALIAAGKTLGLAGVFLILTQDSLYSVYPFSEQAEAGAVMVLMMLLIDFTIAPYWLYNYFGKGTQIDLPPKGQS